MTPTQDPTSTTAQSQAAVLFLCPHNAAKSVAAAAFLAREAASRQLHVTIKTAGTEPDADVLPLVRDRLTADGYVVDDSPKMVTAAHLSSADVIINMGCDHADLQATTPITDWTVPNFSDDPAAAFAAIDRNVVALVDELAP